MKHPASGFILTLVLGGAHLAFGATLPTDPPHRLNASESETARAGAPFRVFSGWLDALNSDDPARLHDYLAQRYPSVKADGFDRLRYHSNGLELRALDQATATNIAGLVQERDSDNFLRFNLALKPDEPDQIDFLEILYIPRPVDFPPPRMTEAEIFAALDAKLAKAAAADRFSGTVLVTHDGKTIYRAARGLADRGKNRSNDINTRFDIGSMNKMFTATAIMQLVQAGKLKLSDPLGKYLPYYPNKEVATKVTLEHLLTHTGGTGNIFGPEYGAHRLELRTHDDYVKWLGARELSFEPGSRFEYSNYGMVLLGVVIEKVTGQSYFDFVEQHIFKPAKMTRTASEPIDALEPGTAIGYMRTPDGVRKPNDEVLAYRGSACGGGHSTVGDLAKFADALMRNKLLNAANTRLLTTGKVEMRPGSKYAYGFIDQREAAGNFGHDGGGPGLNGVLLILPDSGHVVAVLSNIDPPFAGRIGQYLALRLENRKP